MPKIKFVVEHQVIEVKAGRSIREVAIEAGIYPNREFFRGFNCGGRGLCGTCKVWVKEPSNRSTNPPNLRERFHGMGDGRRLACQTLASDDIEVTTFPGGDDRLAQGRTIDPPPQRAPDPEPPAKPAAEKATAKPEKGEAKKPAAAKGEGKKAEPKADADAGEGKKAEPKADADAGEGKKAEPKADADAGKKAEPKADAGAGEGKKEEPKADAGAGEGKKAETVETEKAEADAVDEKAEPDKTEVGE